ncbi:hypothetical protein GTQ99_04720 [Kineococcus sp. T13]|uniref:N-acetylmuramoyl-L-alanine amidase n=1 Tax=Kineococcus vitellinus TaxID=2696565 RepID=UPI00141332B1|nr:N-acetylmuramoyl-L-alanine amidase [Kineococcus vitellinus]NAZ74727.1 hypothetical protein [Kineococcus vitellinus]
MSVVESILRSLGLWWERLHIFSADLPQHEGVTSRWTRDLREAGETQVHPGELVELHVTLPPGIALTATNPPVRFDILEFDWLIQGGGDDPLESISAPGAPDPEGDFAVLERTVIERAHTATEPSLAAVVDRYCAEHPADFESRVLVVRDAQHGWTDVVAWWRVPVIDDSEPRAYFIAELSEDVRDATPELLHVAPSASPGVSVRVHGTVRDTVTAGGEQAQPVPSASVTLGDRTSTTTAAGTYVIDARVGVGETTLTVSRPGIDTRTYTLDVATRPDGGTDVTVTDENGVQAVTGTAADATLPTVTLQLEVGALVHRVAGTVVWPDTRIIAAGAVPTTLSGRYVCALRLDVGPLRPQLPRTSREWEALRSRPDVLRSARPDRPARGEATDDNGRFELSFVDLRADAQYLWWVEAVDPRDPARRVPEAVVRTIAAPQMRRMNVQGSTYTPDRQDRRVVIATGFLGGGVEAALEVMRVVDTAPEGAPPALRLLRARPVNPDGIDATPPVDVDELVVDAAARRAAGLTLEVLPLIPVLERPEDRSARASWAHTELQTRLDARHPRGHLLNGLRWVLDARLGPTATWDDAAACAVLERTLLSHPSLTPASMHNPSWGWSRGDAVSAADLARVDQGANALFANRSLAEELLPVLAMPVPRLLGLVESRHLLVSPGHGLYAAPAASTTYRTGRAAWSGYSAVIENWGGEDENVVGISAGVRQVAAANGIRTTVGRETDPTVPGIRQLANGTFVAVDPVTAPDHPRLWQQNSYYWIAAVHDQAAPPGGPIVQGNASNGNINSAGITQRLELFRRLAASPLQPVDVFVAVHTNAGAPAARGYLAMYLDIRPTPASPAPGQAGYVEGNTEARAFATDLATEIDAEVGLNNRRARSYYSINGNTTSELATTVDHFRDGSAVQGIRSLTNPNGNLAAISFPRPGGRAIPVGYLELGYHSNSDDAAALAQAWCRNAMAVGIARACEQSLRRRTDALTGLDVVALLRAAFGSIPAVTALTSGANPLGAGAVTGARVGTAIAAASGETPPVAGATLDAVVTAIETAVAGASRRALVERTAAALALLAGYDPADATQADAMAEAALRPLLTALGATIPDGAVPTIDELPREARPPTRADAAAVLAAGLGIRPGDLASITRPVNGVTVLPAALPAGVGGLDPPGAYVTSATIDAAVTAIGMLRPVDAYRLLDVRVTDARGADRRDPLLAGQHIHLRIGTGGTPWRVTPADIRFTVRRAGEPDVTLRCGVRRLDALVTEPWPVPQTAGRTELTVTATITHPTAGNQTLGPVRFAMTVATP